MCGAKLSRLLCNLQHASAAVDRSQMSSPATGWAANLNSWRTLPACLLLAVPGRSRGVRAKSDVLCDVSSDMHALSIAG